jgi:hypothetical protein
MLNMHLSSGVDESGPLVADIKYVQSHRTPELRKTATITDDSERLKHSPILKIYIGPTIILTNVVLLSYS